MTERISIILSAVLLACTTTKALEKSEIKSIIDIYETAFEKRSYGQLESVFHSLDDCPHWELFSYDVKKVDIKEIKGNNVYVKYRLVRYGEPHRWMQLTEDGKIKYDALLMKHPIEVSFKATLGALRKIEVVEKNLQDERHPTDYQRIPYYDQLVATGIPIVEEGKKHLKKSEYMDVLRWLIDNGATWDATEPKIPLPESVFERFANSAEEYL